MVERNPFEARTLSDWIIWLLSLGGFLSALGCSGEPSANEVVRTSTQAVELSETIPFSMTFTRVHVGHDGCGGGVEPDLRSFRIDNVELSPARVRLPDCSQNSSCATNVTYSSEVSTELDTILVTVQLWDNDGGTCGADDLEFSMELVIDPFCGVVLDGFARRHRDGMEQGPVPPGTMSMVLGNWGYDWEINDGEADADGDGIPDCWERRGTVDLDGDGQIDLNFTAAEVDGVQPMHALAADPLVPDIYVEVDWMDCNLGGCEDLPERYCEVGDSGCTVGDAIPDTRDFKPDYDTLLKPIEDVFFAHGYNLHFVMSEALPVSGKLVSLDSKPPADPVTTENSSFDLNEDFPTARSLYLDHLGHPGESEIVRQAKQRFFRYNIWSHARDRGWHGKAWDFGDLSHVSIDQSRPTSGMTMAESRRFWTEIAMHELGHSLGLGHGGRDGWPRKPNYFSVMDGGKRIRDATGLESDPVLNFNEYPTSINECALDEREAVLGSTDPRFVMQWHCTADVPPGQRRGAGAAWPDPADLDATHRWTDWDCDGNNTGTLGAPLDLDGNRVCVIAGKNGILETPPGGDDRVMGGRIEPNSAPTVQSIPDPRDVVDANGHIVPGPSGILETTPHADDQVVDAVIVDGDDRICDSIKQSDDTYARGEVCTQAQRDADVARINDDPATAECYQPCVLEAWNDWENLRVALTGNGVSGDFKNTDVEYSPEQWHRLREASMLADLTLTSSASLGRGRAARDVTLTYTIDNSGPDSAFGVALNLRLPEGVELVSCGAPGGRCLQVGSVVAAGFDTVFSDGSVTAVIVVRLGCQVQPGQDIQLNAEVHSRSLDRDRSSNHTSDTARVLGFLGFEDAERPWVVPFTDGTQTMPVASGNTTEGDHALSLGCGHVQFESPVFDTVELGSVGDELLVDVFLPNGPWQWVGDLSLLVDVPAAGVHNAWVGMVSLGDLPRGTWSTVSIPLTAAAQAALVGDFPHARLRLASNIGLCGVTVLLDHVRFGGELECQERAPNSEPIVSSSVLTFDQVGGWSSSQVQLQSTTTHVTEGTAAVQFGHLGFAELVSRPFAAQELAGVTSRLGFDVRIPELPADFHWLGHMNAFVECPSAGLWKTYLGYHALQILYAGDFNRVEFMVPEHVVSTLSGTASGCRFRLELSANPSFGPFMIDNGGFMLQEAL